MPELPEVETIRRGLQPHLVGRSIVDVEIRERRLRQPVDADTLKKSLPGRTIRRIRRRAKYLLFDLDSGQSLILHLGMSGRVLLLREALPLDRHDHLRLFFQDNLELRYRDPRRFGLVDLWPTARLQSHPGLANLGFEPLDDPLPVEALYRRASGSRKPIKNLLMDAQMIVGVGNIYANEALFYAGIHPETPANALTLEEWKHLLQSLREVLHRAIARGGTTLNDFVNSDGQAGYFQLSLAVYGRAGEPCLQCGTPVERIVQSGRSSFFCPRCQPPPAAPTTDQG